MTSRDSEFSIGNGQENKQFQLSTECCDMELKLSLEGTASPRGSPSQDADVQTYSVTRYIGRGEETR